MKYILKGGRTLSIHSDPDDRDEDKITEVPSGTEVKILDDSPYFGYNDKRYCKIRTKDLKEGYVLFDMIQRVKEAKKR